MTRGTIVWVDLSDARPPEMGKRRPAVVVSNSAHNLVLDSVIGIPLSSVPPEIRPSRVRVQLQGLEGPSFAVVPGMRQLKKSRILRVVGTLNSSDITALDKGIRDYLSD